jgi:hypothetical protein
MRNCARRTCPSATNTLTRWFRKLAEQRAEAQQTGQPVHDDDREQGRGPDGVGLGAGDGRTTDNRADRHGRSEVDDRPPGQRPAFPES